MLARATIMDNAIHKKNTELTKRIMRRIYFVWAIRTILNPLFLKVLIVAAFFWRSMEYISYANVFANAPAITDISGSLQFASAAFANTEGASMALLAGILAVTGWLATDFLRKTQHANF